MTQVTPVFLIPATQEEPNSVTVRRTLQPDGRHIVAEWPRCGGPMAAIPYGQNIVSYGRNIVPYGRDILP